MTFYKYHGAGNDFLLYDAREDGMQFAPERVRALCDRHLGLGSDGLMTLSNAEGYAFRMAFFNPDGSGGMMCGNGGRCIAAFARDLGIAPAADGSYRFLAPDGPHTAWLLSEAGPVKTIRLGMKDVTEYHPASLPSPAAPRSSSASLPSSPTRSGISPWFVDTGTRHLVVFVPSVQEVDVEVLGRQLRHDPAFAPVGVNVNFVEQIAPGEIAVRTFEKGVEAETLACGTGITASAIASFLSAASSASVASAPFGASGSTAVTCLVHARCHDLSVSFVPVAAPDGRLSFTAVTLTGPAERVASMHV